MEKTEKQRKFEELAGFVYVLLRDVKDQFLHVLRKGEQIPVNPMEGWRNKGISQDY